VHQTVIIELRDNLGSLQKNRKKCSVTVVAINDLFLSFKAKACLSHSSNLIVIIHVHTEKHTFINLV